MWRQLDLAALVPGGGRSEPRRRAAGLRWLLAERVRPKPIGGARARQEIELDGTPEIAGGNRPGDQEGPPAVGKLFGEFSADIGQHEENKEPPAASVAIVQPLHRGSDEHPQDGRYDDRLHGNRAK